MKTLFTICFLFFSRMMFAQEEVNCLNPNTCNGDCAHACSQPSITFPALPQGATVLKGSTFTSQIIVNAQDIVSKVTASVSGAPAGTSASLSQVDSTGAPVQHWGSETGVTFFTTLTIATTGSVVAGTYPIALSGVSAFGTHSRPTWFALNIVSALASISPGGNSAAAGSSLSYTVTYGGPGYDGPITPSCRIRDNPAAVSVTVSPSSLPAIGGTATATVSIAPGAGSADYALLCNGTGTGVYILDAAANVHVN